MTIARFFKPRSQQTPAERRRWRYKKSAPKVARATSSKIKKVIYSQKPTKYHMIKNEVPDVTNTLTALISPSQLPFSSTEAENHYKRESYKVKALNMYLQGEVLVNNSSTRPTKLRIMVLKGYRAGGLTLADMEFTQPGFVYTDQYLMFTNPKNCRVVHDKTYTLNQTSAALPAVHSGNITFKHNVRLNEIWRFPSADPAFSPDPINPGAYQVVVISNAVAGQGPKVDINCRLSFKDA